MASLLPSLFIPEGGSICTSTRPWGHSPKDMHLVIWNKICKYAIAFSERGASQQLLFVTVSKVMPFNSWQVIQRGTERGEGRGEAYGKWNDSSDQNKLFLVSLGSDPIIRLSVRSHDCCSRDSPDGHGENNGQFGDSLHM